MLNCLEKYNVFDDIMIVELICCFVKVGSDFVVCVVVLVSNGKNFCVGVDVGWMQ